MTFQFINNKVIFLLTCVKQLIIINYQSLNYAVTSLLFCLEVVIYKRLQM